MRKLLAYCLMVGVGIVTGLFLHHDHPVRAPRPATPASAKDTPPAPQMNFMTALADPAKPRFSVVSNAAPGVIVPPQTSQVDPWTPYVILPSYPGRIIGQVNGHTGKFQRLPETIMPESADLRQFLSLNR